MNKKGQSINQIIYAILGLFIIGALLSSIPSIFNQNCPACDCSAYQNALSDCQTNLTLAQTEIQNRPVIYVNQTVEVPVNNTIEKVVYREGESPVSITIIFISLILSFAITLFSFKIKLPKKLEDELEDLENTIKMFKVASLIVTILIFIKLLIMFNLL